MITVKYSCDLCGIEKRDVAVPSREHKHVDIKFYVEQIIVHAIKDDHSKASPHCKSKMITKLMIPLPPEGGFIGQEVE
jgi:hypothetical protein